MWEGWGQGCHVGSGLERDIPHSASRSAGFLVHYSAVAVAGRQLEGQLIWGPWYVFMYICMHLCIYGVVFIDIFKYQSSREFIIAAN